MKICTRGETEQVIELGPCSGHRPLRGQAEQTRVCAFVCVHICVFNPQPLREVSMQLRGWAGWAALGIRYRGVFLSLILWFICWTPDIDLQCAGH